MFVIGFFAGSLPLPTYGPGASRGVSVIALNLPLTMSWLMEFFRAVTDESEVSDVLILLPT